MAAKGEPNHIDRGYAAAVRRFPDSELAIRRLLSQSEAFRDMCEELADAEQALVNVSAVSPTLIAERQMEWQELVDRLLAEIEVALNHSQAWQSRVGR